MFKRTIAFTIVLWTMSVGSGYAQQCMHGSSETTDQAARRRQALTATRTINNIQSNQPGRTAGCSCAMSISSRASSAGDRQTG